MYIISNNSPSIQQTSLRKHAGHSRAFELVCLSCSSGAPTASHLHCNAAQIYNPVQARVTSHLSEHCGPPLSLWMGVHACFLQNTHTHTHFGELHTCYPNQTSPLPSLLCRSALRSLCPAGVLSTSQKVNKQRKTVKLR